MVLTKKVMQAVDKKLEKTSDPLTKWVTRLALIFLAVATCSWLDSIKVRDFLRDKLNF